MLDLVFFLQWKIQNSPRYWILDFGILLSLPYEPFSFLLYSPIYLLEIYEQKAGKTHFFEGFLNKFHASARIAWIGPSPSKNVLCLVFDHTFRKCRSDIQIHTTISLMSTNMSTTVNWAKQLGDVKNLDFIFYRVPKVIT